MLRTTVLDKRRERPDDRRANLVFLKAEYPFEALHDERDAGSGKTDFVRQLERRTETFIEEMGRPARRIRADIFQLSVPLDPVVGDLALGGRDPDDLLEYFGIEAGFLRQHHPFVSGHAVKADDRLLRELCRSSHAGLASVNDVRGRSGKNRAALFEIRFLSADHEAELLRPRAGL